MSVSGILIASTATPAISLIAGAAGAVGGVMLARSDGVTNAIRDLESYGAICQCLIKKFDADVQQCAIIRHDRHQQALKDAISVLEAAGVIQPSRSDDRIPNDENWNFPSTLVEPETLQHSVSHLVAAGPIRVNCSVISVAAICTLYSIARRYRRFGLEIEIDNDFRNGREQMAALSSREPYDFIIAPNDPFFLADKNATKSYRMLGPINGEIQRIFRRKSRHEPRSVRVLTYKSSSAELHFLSRRGVPSNAEPEYVEDAIEIAERIDDIGGGDCVFAWEPLSDLLDGHDGFEPITGSKHTIQFSLFCHRSWRHVKKKSLRNTFKQIFLNEWLYCVANRNEQLRYLQKDIHFMRHFALGCGRTMPSSVTVRALRWLKYTLPSGLQVETNETEIG